MNNKTIIAMRAFGIVKDDTTPEPESQPVPTFDGGARGDQPPPAQTHSAWLADVLAGRVEPE